MALDKFVEVFALQRIGLQSEVFVGSEIVDQIKDPRPLLFLPDFAVHRSFPARK